MKREGAGREAVEVEIHSIAAGGEGVGRLPDGRVVFVHRTAPDERVQIRLDRQRGSWARGSLLRVLRPSPSRRDAPCPHYHDCGGCSIEHLEYPAQLRAKSEIVASALARIGGARVDLPEVTPSPRQHRYRNRVSFALRRLRGGRIIAGFHSLHDPDRIVDVDGDCLLPEEPIGEAWDDLRASWGPDADRLPDARQLRLTLRSTARGRVSLIVEGGVGGRMEELIGVVRNLDSIWHRPAAGAAALVAGAPGLPESWGDETFEVAGSAFLQVNREAAARLEAHVLEVAGEVAGMRVVDAYCGIGLHARRLAGRGAEVVGIELDPEAVEVASSSPQPGATYLVGRVEERLPEALPADLVIVNPPRAGLDAAVAEQLVASRPGRIVYISCDPATLARDVKRLATAFSLARVRCFDLFPQTAHVETVAELTACATS